MPVAPARLIAQVMPERCAMNSPQSRHRVVIVGGGAGGLELATRLGDRSAGAARRTSR